MREVICILESNSSERSFQDATPPSKRTRCKATSWNICIIEGQLSAGRFLRTKTQKSIWTQLSQALERAILIPPSCSTIATHLSRRIPVEPVTERASGRPRKLDPRPGGVLAEAPFLSSFLSASPSLPLLPSFS